MFLCFFLVFSWFLNSKYIFIAVNKFWNVIDQDLFWAAGEESCPFLFFLIQRQDKVQVLNLTKDLEVFFRLPFPLFLMTLIHCKYSEIHQAYELENSLRSSGIAPLLVQRSNLTTKGDRAFVFWAPWVPHYLFIQYTFFVVSLKLDHSLKLCIGFTLETVSLVISCYHPHE